MVYPWFNDDWSLAVFTATCFLGLTFLCSCGDAKYLSLRMLQLLFVSALLWVPQSFIGAVCYGLNILIFSCMIAGFYHPKIKQNYQFYSAYSGKLDTFYYHWLLIVVAAAIPTGILANGREILEIDGCLGDPIDRGMCAYTTVWAISFFLFPMSFLPQGWILIRYRVSGNIRFFFFFMCIYSFVVVDDSCPLYHNCLPSDNFVAIFGFVFGVCACCGCCGCCGKQEEEDADDGGDDDDGDDDGDDDRTAISDSSDSNHGPNQIENGDDNPNDEEVDGMGGGFDDTNRTDNVS